MMLRMSPELVASLSRVELSTYLTYEAGTDRIPAGVLFEVARVLSVPVRFVFDRYALAPDAAKVWASHPDVPIMSATSSSGA